MRSVYAECSWTLSECFNLFVKHKSVIYNSVYFYIKINIKPVNTMAKWKIKLFIELLFKLLSYKSFNFINAI